MARNGMQWHGMQWDTDLPPNKNNSRVLKIFTPLPNLGIFLQILWTSSGKIASPLLRPISKFLTLHNRFFSKIFDPSSNIVEVTRTVLNFLIFFYDKISQAQKSTNLLTVNKIKNTYKKHLRGKMLLIRYLRFMPLVSCAFMLLVFLVLLVLLVLLCAFCAWEILS